MRKVLLSALITISAFGVMAQNPKKMGAKASAKKTSTTPAAATKPTVKATWKTGGMISLTLAQGGSRNWAPGGERFVMATNGFLNLFANQTKGKWTWNSMMDANFGMMNTDKYGTVKNDDKLELISKWTREVGTPSAKGINRYRLGLTTNFRTQFADGYDFDGEQNKRISSFFAPGILVVSPGLDYVEVKNFNVHFSPFAGRWILVPNRPYELGPNYGVKSNQEVKNEFGSYLSVGYSGEIMKNVSLRTRLDVYSNYMDKKPGNMDIYFTNMLYLKVNKCIGLVYSFDLQYDDDTRIFGYNKNATGTQLKSILGVGLSCKF